LFGGVRSRLTLVLSGLPILPAVVVLVYTLVAGASITPVMVVAAAAVVAALLGSRLIAQWTAPINQLIASAQAVARGEKREPLRLNRGDEFDLLAEAINQVEVRLHSTLQQASEERARLASVLAHLVSGVILTDPKGTVVLVNPAVRRLLGVTQEPIGAGPVSGLSARSRSTALRGRMCMLWPYPSPLTMCPGRAFWLSLETSLKPGGCSS